MKKYKVVGSSKTEFMGIEMDIMFDDVSIGKQCEVFGTQFTITQPGKILVLSHKDWVLTLQELPPEEIVIPPHTIKDSAELRINYEVDVFLEPKHIRLTPTDRLTDEGVTFECLYKFLLAEWKYIFNLTGVMFPFGYDIDTQVMLFKDSWNYDSIESFVYMREGSYTRLDANGRII